MVQRQLLAHLEDESLDREQPQLDTMTTAAEEMRAVAAEALEALAECAEALEEARAEEALDQVERCAALPIEALATSPGADGAQGQTAGEREVPFLSPRPMQDAYADALETAEAALCGDLDEKSSIGVRGFESYLPSASSWRKSEQEEKELVEEEEKQEPDDMRGRILRHHISWPAQTALDMEDHLSRAHDITVFWFFEWRDRAFAALPEHWQPSGALDCIHEYPLDWPQWRIDSFQLRETARSARAAQASAQRVAGAGGGGVVGAAACESDA